MVIWKGSSRGFERVDNYLHIYKVFYEGKYDTAVFFEICNKDVLVSDRYGKDSTYYFFN